MFRALFVWFLLAGAGMQAADVVVAPPIHFAFNGGIYTAEALAEQTALGRAEEIDSPDGQVITVRHLWVEAFENDAKMSTRQTTVFEVCDSTFTPSVDGPRVLTELVVTYVLLDYSGRPLGSPHRIRFSQPGTNWVRSDASAEDLRDFFNHADEFVQRNLRRTSGFLASFPGQAPVQYLEDAQKEKMFRLLGIAIGVALPEISVEEVPLMEWILNAAKDLLKVVGLDALKERYRTDEARWGRDAFPSDRRLQEDTEIYENAGKQIWPGFPDDLTGVWESDDSPQPRFRLEISGAAVNWTERRNDQEIRRSTVVQRQPDGWYKIERPNDAEIIRFLFDTPQTRTLVLSQSPAPSFLLLKPTDDGLKGTFSGIGFTTNGTFFQPSSAPRKPYAFTDIRFAEP